MLISLQLQIHKCDLCPNYVSTNEEGLLEHRRTIHPPPPQQRQREEVTPTNFQCDNCTFVTSSQKYLENHTCFDKNNYHKQSVECGSCGFMATTKAHLTNHKKMCGGMRAETLSAVDSISQVKSSNDVHVVAEVEGGDVGTAGLEYKPNVQGNSSSSNAEASHSNASRTISTSSGSTTSNSNAPSNSQPKQGEKTAPDNSEPKEKDEEAEILTNHTFESQSKGDSNNDDDDDDVEVLKCGFERCFFETPFVYDMVEHMNGEHDKSYNSEVKSRDWKAAKKVFKCLKCDFSVPKESSFIEHLRNRDYHA